MENEDPTAWINKADHVTKEQVEKHYADRAKNGFSWYDWINFHNYLSFVIIGGLKKFRADAAGYPSSVTEDEWNEILDKMIAGFEANQTMADMTGWDHQGSQSYTEWAKPYAEKWEEGSALFIKYYSSLWD